MDADSKFIERGVFIVGQSPGDSYFVVGHIYQAARGFGDE
jgi:hypothetical protein